VKSPLIKMNSIIQENNRATGAIFTFMMLPYFNLKDLQNISQINQEIENHSYETYIDNLEQEQEIRGKYFEHHKNIVGCGQEEFFEFTKPLLLRRLWFCDPTDENFGNFIEKFINLKYLRVNWVVTGSIKT